jgi:hypothetical protein
MGRRDVVSPHVFPFIFLHHVVVVREAAHRGVDATEVLFACFGKLEGIIIALENVHK